jgi:hypothetical protein
MTDGNMEAKIFIHIKYDEKEHIYIVYDESSFIVGTAKTHKKASKIANNYINFLTKNKI